MRHRSQVLTNDFTKIFLIFVVLSGLGFTSSVYAQSAGGVRRLRTHGSSNTSSDTNTKQNQDKELHDKYVMDMPTEVTIPELTTEDFDRVASDLKISKEQDEKLKNLRSEIATQRKTLLDAQRDIREKFIKASLADMEVLAPKLVENRTNCINFKPRQVFFNGLVNILLPEQRSILTTKNIPART